MKIIIATFSLPYFLLCLQFYRALILNISADVYIISSVVFHRNDLNKMTTGDWGQLRWFVLIDKRFNNSHFPAMDQQSCAHCRDDSEGYKERTNCGTTLQG